MMEPPLVACAQGGPWGSATWWLRAWAWELGCGQSPLSQPVLSFVRHPAVACTIGTCTSISLDLEEVTL